MKMMARAYTAALLTVLGAAPLTAQRSSSDTTSAKQFKGDTTASAQPQPDTTSAERTSKSAPFAFADFTWVNGNGRAHYSPLATKYFTPEFRLDANYISDLNQPEDHTLDGSAETGRTNEVQVQQLGIGGDFRYDNVRGRLMTQFGMYSEETPRDDPSPARGQWDLADAYRYVSEAYGGYHWNAMHGINLDVGIFLSYIGLFSYYNADNWAYQPSYVSANTPWYFNGVRLQTFPSDKLKIEYWFINGWQSYGMFNHQPGFGTEILYRPIGSISMLSNDYYGYDDLGEPSRMRIHSDNSFLLKYYDQPANFWDKSAFSVTGDAGCESGDGVHCVDGNRAKPDQYFLGFMFYDRNWFKHDRYGLTVGGGAINNPGRYLVLLPPINGATAASGTPYFTTNPGNQFQAWDMSATFDYMPNDFVNFRGEVDHRESSVPYFVGRGGITPPGGNTGAPGSIVPGWAPDLVRDETRFNFAVLVKL
jgi:Putative beta-barrel porin-2, OmpL-like. bbp2